MIQVDASDFKRFLTNMQNISYREPLQSSGDRLIATTKRRIVVEITPDGKAFTPLAPSTIASKKGDGILRETLRMFNAFLTRFVSKDQVSVELDNVPYDAVHQFGTSKVPQREFLGVNRTDADEIEEEFANYIERVMRL